MMADKKQLLQDGRVTAEEARAFIDKYRQEPRKRRLLIPRSSTLRVSVDPPLGVFQVMSVAYTVLALIVQ